MCVCCSMEIENFIHTGFCAVWGKLGQSVICLVIQTKTTTTASVFKTDGINNAIILAGWGWQCYCPKLRLIVYL